MGTEGWETMSAGRSVGDPSRQVQPAHGAKRLGPRVCRGQLNGACARVPVWSENACQDRGSLVEDLVVLDLVG